MDLETSIQSNSSRVEEYYFRQRAVSIFIFGVLIGILGSSFVFISPLVSVFLLLVSISIVSVERVWHKRVRGEVLLLILMFASFGIGVLRYDIKDFHIYDAYLEGSIGQDIEIRGIVSSEPELKDSFTRIVVSTESENILVNADMFIPLRYGDELLVRGELHQPEIIDDGVGRPFDYPQYLAKDDIYFILSFAKIEVLSSGHGSALKRALFGIKNSFVSQIRSILSEPQASLLAGLVVAGKDSLPQGILDEFRRAGIVHIVVLSGYNITIIAEFMRKMFENIFLWTRVGARPRAAAGASILGIMFFVLMTGAEPTVVRASLMVLAVIAAKLLGRSYSASRALLVAAFLMILHNPKILVFDPSFQLSFLATLALIYVVPIAERYIQWLTDKWGIRTMVATTVSTQTVVLPYLVYSMGEVSLVSLPANILVLLFIPLTMFVGFVAVSLSYMSTLLALPFAFISHVLLSWILGVSHVLGSLHTSSIEIPPLSIWVIILLYVGMLIFVQQMRSSPPHSAN